MKTLLKKVDKLQASKLLVHILFFCILVGALAARLYRINNPIADWHSWRQADTASVTRTYATQGINIFFPRYHDISTVQTGEFNPEGYRLVEFPLYNAIHANLFLNYPVFSLEIWGRLLSIFFSLISTFLLFLISKRFMGKWGGILASFFYAFIPFNIYFTRVILPEPMSIALGLLSIYLFIRFYDTGKFVWLFSSGLVLALAMLIKPFVFFYLLPMAYLTHQKYAVKKVFKNANLLIPFLLFIFSIVIPFLLWRVWINNFPEGIPFYWWMFNGDKIRFKPSWWRWIFGERLGHLILGGWGLIPFTFGIIEKNKSFFIHFFLLGVFSYVSIFATVNVRHDYYQTVIIPAICLALAEGCMVLWTSKVFNKVLARLVLIFSIVVMFLTGALQIKEFYKINHPEILIAGEVVNRLTPKDSLVIAPYNGDTAFLYQTGRWGWPYVDRPIEELIEKGADYYVSVNFDDQTNEFINKFKVLEQNSQYVILDLHKNNLK